MARKTNFSINIDISVLVSILVGIIVLLAVYIIVNNKKQVTFSVPEVTEEIIIPSYYREEPVFLQQPTYFNPNLSFLGHSHDHGRQGNTTNMYNIQTKEPFTGFSDFVSSVLPTRTSNMTSTISSPTMPSTVSPTMSSTISPSSMPSMNNASQSVQMNIPMPMEGGTDSAASI